MVDYKLKLKALLHDPIHKIWCFNNVKSDEIKHKDYYINQKLKLHERVAEDLYGYLFFESLEDEVVKQADQIASSLSRIVVSPQIDDENKKEIFKEDNSIFFQDAKYINFLTGEKQEIGTPKSHDEVEGIFKKLGDLTFEKGEERARYYFLFLWRFLPEIFSWINNHPADSRAPNHSIYDHLVQTSAVATCIENNNKPAFLLFTIGPVQSFIAAAKKISDLWAGSFLLSYLTYQAIEVLMEELGPDHIIFPNLIKQPLVNRWLYYKLKDKEVDLQYFKEWKEKWEKQTKNDSKEKPFDDILTIANIPNRFLAIVPESKAKELGKMCKNKVFKVLEELNDSKNIDIQKQQIQSYFNTYWIVLPWGESVDKVITEYENFLLSDGDGNTLFDLIKLIKSYPYYKESKIGITYSLLVELAERFLAARKTVRDFKVIKPQTGKKCPVCGEFEVVGKDVLTTNNEEELCGVCLLKRKLPQIMKEKLNLKEKIRYLSTSDLPTVKYKEGLSPDIKEDLKTKLKNINIEIEKSFISIPKLKDDKLYTIDGQFLMGSTYRKEYLEKEFNLKVNEENLNEIKNFLQDNKIKPPVYYAIIAMDGDEMGKWLSGDKMLKVEELLHPKSVEALKNFWDENKKADLEKILSSPHPMSPSFHTAFSRSLSDFALDEVKKIVEEDFYGKLIYTGGDDVLAFLPVDDALKASFELQNTFKKKLSPQSSMSAGIVFVHHKYPLQLALNEVRDAEKLAKGKYGRDSCCIKLIKGSGERRVVGFKWEDKDLFEKIIGLYKEKNLSSKFAYDFMEIVKNLKPDNNNDMVKIILVKEFERIYRHKILKDENSENFLGQILEKFKAWKYGFDEFANLFIVARFISNEGRE